MTIVSLDELTLRRDPTEAAFGRRPADRPSVPPARESAGGIPRPAAVSIGVFDSVHIGHQRLIRAVVDNRLGVLPVVCTFRQSPRSVLGAGPAEGSVLSFRQKLAKLESLGVAEVVLIDFSPEISKLTGKGFIELLERYLLIRKLVVGFNFHMGKDRHTDVEKLRGILRGSETELVVVPATFHKGRVVSSSRIRQTIRDGDFSEVRAMIGEPFCLDLREADIVVRGVRAEAGREALGQILPRPGEYPAVFKTQSEEHSAGLTVLENAVQWTRDWQEREIEICFANDTPSRRRIRCP